jgi:hypothetical protein
LSIGSGRPTAGWPSPGAALRGAAVLGGGVVRRTAVPGECRQGQAVTDIEAALRRKSFHDRIAEKLADDPAWN